MLKPRSAVGSPSKVPSTRDASPVSGMYILRPVATEHKTLINADFEITDETSSLTDFYRTSKHNSIPSIESVTSSIGGDTTSPESSAHKNTPDLRTRSKSRDSQRTKTISQHDLLNKYFKRDAVLLRNIDLLR